MPAVMDEKRDLHSDVVHTTVRSCATSSFGFPVGVVGQSGRVSRSHWTIIGLE